MKLIIQSPPGQLPYLLAAHLEDLGYHPELDFKNDEHGGFALCHGKGVSARTIETFKADIRPFAPFAVMDEELDDDAVRLVLPLEQINDYDLHIKADSNQQLDWLQDVTGQGLGMDQSEAELELINANELRYGNAPAWLRQAIRFLLYKKGGIQLREAKKFSDDDSDLYLQIRDPQLESRPLKERASVIIASDSLPLGESFKEILEQRGFSCQSVIILHPDDLEDGYLGIQTSWMDYDYPLQDLNEIRVLLKTFAKTHGVDFERYPVKMESDIDELDINVFLPISACLEKSLRPYAGPYPERFSIKIFTDDFQRAAGLVQRLKNVRFKSIDIEKLEKTELIKGFRFGWCLNTYERSVEIEVGRLFREAMKEMALERFNIVMEGKFSMLALSASADIVIAFPLKAAIEGDLEAEIASPSNFKLTVTMPDPADGWDTYIENLKKYKFMTLNTEPGPGVRSPIIKYGMAPESLLDRIEGIFSQALCVGFERQEEYDGTDNTIKLHLPAWGDVVKGKSKVKQWPGPDDLSSWFTRSTKKETGRRRFIARQSDRVRVGDVWLRRRRGKPHPLTPPPDLFKHFCIDEQTAETLYHIALSFKLKEPCLLEGETSTSKTSGVLYLAHLLRQPVFRLNLSGQTDTGDLVGRFIPNEDESGSGKMRWRWQDGMAVQALKTGAILLLDEVNMPRDPSIPERLNSLLEDPPSLTLTEKDNRVYGPMGEAVHDMFRIAGTMNPARYVGRGSMSPAWRDRWRASRFVPRPGETEYRQMLNYLVFGKQPDIRCQGDLYRGVKTNPRMAELAEIEGIEGMLDSLAAVHAALEKAFGDQRPKGSGITDTLTYTRRGILSVMEYLCHEVRFNGTSGIGFMFRRALYRYYFQRTFDDTGRQAILQIFEAFGLGAEVEVL